MTGPVDLQDELAQALSARAAAVTTAPTPAARAGVDQRLAHRHRRRRRRRGAAAGAVAIVLALLSPVGRDRTGGDDGTDVVAGRDLDPADDPARSGLPRLAVDPSAGLRAVVEEDPLVREEAQPTGHDALAEVDRIRVARVEGALVPAAFVPEPADRAGPGVDLASGYDDAGRVWTGKATGWSEHDAALADPTRREAFSFGVGAGDLADVRAGLVPPGYVVRDVTGDPAEPAVAPGYQVRYVAPGVEGGLRVWAESDLRREAALLRVLAGAEVVVAVEVDGRPGVLARHPGGPWSVGWSPAEGVTAALIVAGDDVDRSQVEAIAGAVGTVGEREWAALVAQGRS